MSSRNNLNFAFYDTAELVELARSGESTAFNELVKRYQALALRTAFSILKNQADAEDAFQEASLNAFRKLHTFAGEAAFSTWWTRIVINTCLMQLRRQRRNRLCSLDELMARDLPPQLPLSHPGLSPEQSYIRQQDYSKIRRAAQQLPTQFRDVIQDQVFDELSIAQLAVKRGLSLSAAKSRLFRARRMMLRNFVASSAKQRFEHHTNA